MRVVVLGSYPRSLINFRGRLIEAMVAAGHEVTGCAPGADPAVARALAERGADYRSIDLDRCGLNPIRDLASLVGMVRLFGVLKPEVLLAYTAKPLVYGSFAARLAGVDKVFTMITGLGYAFGDGDRTIRRQFLRSATVTLYRRALASSTATFVLNPHDREDLLRLGIAKPTQRIEVVDGSGIDLEHFGVAPLPTSRPTFLMIARLIRDKGVAEFAEAADLLREQYPDARFLLLGRLEDHPASIRESEIRAWEAAGRIEYLGVTDDVRPYLRDCAVFVLPTYYREGLPRTILEAMATGRPIITTDVPGCRETVLPSENGFLVPPRDPAALADAMQRFLLDPQLAPRMGLRSRELAEARFDVRRVNAAMLKVMGL